MTSDARSPERSAPASVDRLKDLGLRWLLAFLVVWTPFFFFSAYRGHPVPSSELLYSALLFALPSALLALLMGPRAGLRRVIVLALMVGVFLDLQFRWFGGALGVLTTLALAGGFWVFREHLLVILTAVFATTLLSTLLAPPAPSEDNTLVAPAGRADATVSRPSDPQTGTLVHLILDEFAGVEGIPLDVEGGPALRREITAFFEGYGFVLHPRAFSEYPSSKHSIGSLLNFEASRHPKENFRGKRPYVLLENRDFEILARRHAEIHVTQSNYMDFCTESKVQLTSCFTYRFDGTEWLEGAALDEDAKLDVLLGMYFNMPGFFEFAAKTYVRTRNRLEGLGLSLPALRDWDGTVAPIAANVGFEHFTQTLVEAPSGSAHFGHLLIPHGPYVYDSRCQLTREPLDWLGPRPRHEKENTDASRTLRYQAYLPQVRCTLLQLGEFFDTLQAAGRFAGTTFILHGDHGARFYRTKLLEENRAAVTADDLADGYSTLFAIRPGTSSRLDADAPVLVDRKTPRPVSRLLAGAMRAEAAPADSRRIVFLEGDDSWFEIEWPLRGLEASR